SMLPTIIRFGSIFGLPARIAKRCANCHPEGAFATEGSPVEQARFFAALRMTLLHKLKLAARIAGDRLHQARCESVVKRDRVKGNLPYFKPIVRAIPQPHLLNRIRVELPVG